MYFRVSIPFAIGATLLAVGCSDLEQSAPLAPEAHRTSWTASDIAEAEITAQRLARAFAAAMREPEVRVQVRNAMRASMYNEHKLLLQEFAQTSGGRVLIAAAARTSDVSEGDIEAMVAALPEMDFYAPFREHRLTWRGTADVAVGASMEIDGTDFKAYTVNGQTVGYRSQGRIPEATWLFMHPAEPKSRRRNPQPSVPGEVIQDPNDGIGTFSMEPGDGGGGGGSTTGMTLTQMINNIFDGIGDAEIRFIVEDANLNQLAATTIDNYYQYSEYTGHWQYVGFSTVRGTYLHIREIDTWDSDDFGRAPLPSSNGTVSNGTELNCWNHYYYNSTVERANYNCGPQEAFYTIRYWHVQVQY